VLSVLLTGRPRLLLNLKMSYSVRLSVPNPHSTSLSALGWVVSLQLTASHSKREPSLFWVSTTVIKTSKLFGALSTKMEKSPVSLSDRTLKDSLTLALRSSNQYRQSQLGLNLKVWDVLLYNRPRVSPKSGRVTSLKS
jgi:hypothetical protein